MFLGKPCVFVWSVDSNHDAVLNLGFLERIIKNGSILGLV